MPLRLSKLRRKAQTEWLVMGALVLSTYLVAPARFPPGRREGTESIIFSVLTAIHNFAELHEALPNSVENLYEIEGDRTSITDAWGNPIRYKVSDGGLLLLGSYGADGVPGGTGRHQDILWIYKTHNSDGQLVAGGELWMVCLEVQGPSRSISLDAQLPDYCADYR